MPSNNEICTLDLKLPYPLPYSTNKVETSEFKGKQWKLFAQKTKIGIPSSVGALIVFLFLDIKDIVKLAFTSKSMLSIALEAIRFKEVWDFRNFREFSFVNFDKLLQLMNGPVSIESMNIVNCERSVRNCTLNTVFVSLLSRIVTLRMIKSCTTAELAAILTRCQCLEVLETDSLSDDGVYALQNNRLTSLTLIGCSELAIEGMTALYLKFNLSKRELLLSVTDLVLSGVGFIRLASALEIEVESVLNLTLEVIDCKYFTNDIAKEFFTILGHNYQINLNHVILRNSNISSDTLKQLRSVSKLDVQYIDFRDSHEVFSPLKSSENSLSHLAIRNPENLKLINIASLFNCGALTSLNLAHCSSIVDDTFISVLSRKTRNLEVINLDSCHRVSNKGLRSLCRSCKYLAKLNLSRCELIDDRGIEEIVIYMGKRVTELKLRGCYRLTSIGVTRIGITCLNLNVFDVSWCFQVCKSSLCMVTKKCRKLEVLVFEGLSQISDLERDTIYQLSYRLQKKARKKLRRLRSAPKFRIRKQRSLSMIPQKDLGFVSPSEREKSRNSLNRRSSTFEFQESFSIDSSIIIEQEEIEARSSLFKLSLSLSPQSQ